MVAPPAPKAPPLPPAPPARCARCGTEVAPSLLACPACRQLIHSAELTRLAAEAERAAAAGDDADALGYWRTALGLLPPDSGQYASVAERIAALEAGLSPPPGAAPSRAGTAAGPPSLAKRGGILGTVALLAWKLKFVLVFLLTKAKLLLLGLTKAGTLLSMFASFGVYWAVWGWRFAAGFVLSIYVHEMGHVAMLARYGIRAEAPMFIPGFGAFVRWRTHIADPRRDARVGLAGPAWGLGAAVASYAVYRATGVTLWAAIANAGAWINIMNLLPVWQLDGARAFHALDRRQRWMATAAAAASWLVTREVWLAMLAAVAAWRSFAADPKMPDEGDWSTLWWFAFVALALGAVAMAVRGVGAGPL